MTSVRITSEEERASSSCLVSFVCVRTRAKEERFKRYYMHKTSHYLGMDVHDVGRYFEEGKARPLEPGVVITVEPGLYIAANDDKVPPEYRGIGVRIEDDVLVTAGGHRVMSDAIPRRTADVEQACRPR